MAIDDMLRNPKFTLDSLSDDQVAVLHEKMDRAWHKAAAAMAEIPVHDQRAFSAMSRMFDDITDMRSMTYQQIQARAARNAAWF